MAAFSVTTYNGVHPMGVIVSGGGTAIKQSSSLSDQEPEMLLMTLPQNCTQFEIGLHPTNVQMLIPVWSKHVEKELPKTEKSSINTSIVFSIMSWKIAIIHLWNVPGALQGKAMRRKAKLEPRCVESSSIEFVSTKFLRVNTLVSESFHAIVLACGTCKHLYETLSLRSLKIKSLAMKTGNLCHPPIMHIRGGEEVTVSLGHLVSTSTTGGEFEELNWIMSACREVAPNHIFQFTNIGRYFSEVEAIGTTIASARIPRELGAILPYSIISQSVSFVEVQQVSKNLLFVVVVVCRKATT
ncbi:hypothetical protein Tco_1004028 [Tanacetum coccineum]|uniref:Uncharacterized protein n=1 Tax=Tanacetum coccineum TaxID=301880 RepID=A0ABQ5FC24_9ASTR